MKKQSNDERRISKIATEKKILKIQPKKGLGLVGQALVVPKHFKSELKAATVTQVGNQLIVTASKDFGNQSRLSNSNIVYDSNIGEIFRDTKQTNATIEAATHSSHS